MTTPIANDERVPLHTRDAQSMRAVIDDIDRMMCEHDLSYVDLMHALSQYAFDIFADAKRIGDTNVAKRAGNASIAFSKFASDKNIID